jgi:hypothetical protein
MTVRSRGLRYYRCPWGTAAAAQVVNLGARIVRLCSREVIRFDSLISGRLRSHSPSNWNIKVMILIELLTLASSGVYLNCTDRTCISENISMHGLSVICGGKNTCSLQRKMRAFILIPGLERRGTKMTDELIEKIILDLQDIPRSVPFRFSSFKVSDPFLSRGYLPSSRMQTPDCQVVLPTPTPMEPLSLRRNSIAYSISRTSNT